MQCLLCHSLAARMCGGRGSTPAVMQPGKYNPRILDQSASETIILNILIEVFISDDRDST